MATVIQLPGQEQELQEGQRFLLTGVTWKLYKTMVDELGDRPALRLTYDGRDLELMTIGQLHEWLKTWLGQLIDMLCWEVQIPKRSGGSFTHQREDLLRGIEPDNCYWIQNEPVVRGQVEVDLLREPPPDLAVEIEITCSVLNRLGIFAALRIPEVWRCSVESIEVNLLQDDGTYAVSETSTAFPFLPMQEFARFLRIDDPRDDLTRLREFVDWMRPLAGKSGV